MGASRAAERIAWTLCSRKTIALVEEREEEAGSSYIDRDQLLLGLDQVGRESAAAVLDEAGLVAEALSDEDAAKDQATRTR